MKSAPWILFTVALLYILYLQNCNKPAPSVPQSVYDVLQKMYNDTLEDYHAFRRQSDSAINNAANTAIQAGEQAQQSQAALDQERKKNNQLLLKLDSAAKEKPDSTWVQVSPRYKEGCDSLRVENLTLNYRIIQAEQDNRAHVDALNHETQVRDSALQKERIFSKVFQQQLITCMNSLNDAEKAAKKSQLYAGIAAWGNALTPLGGGEINLGLKTKKDQFYEVKGAYLGTWWVGVGTKFKLSF